MPRRTWNATRERQYEEIRRGLRERGTPALMARGIAARTLNRSERAPLRREPRADRS
jgi:hypothetical protein